MFNEDFERCPACGHPYFKKRTRYTLMKDENRKVYSPTIIKEELTDFVCASCEHALTVEYKKESLETYEEG